MPEYQVRTANFSDICNISDLCSQLGYQTTQEQILERLKVLLNLPDHAIFVITYQKNQIAIGWVHVLLVQYLETEKFAEIGGLVIDHQHRKSGLGKQLMNEAENWVRDQGVSTIRLRSNTIRSEAHKFYEKIGYQNQKSQFTFVKQLV